MNRTMTGCMLPHTTTRYAIFLAGSGSRYSAAKVKRTTEILVVKSTIHYRAAFEPIAREIIEVDAPSLSSSNLARFDFTRIRRPIFPLDPDTRYEPA